MQTTQSKTWARLKPDTPFNHLFPDGLVPIRSALPIVPREEGCPLCYLVPGAYLTEEQIQGLAELLYPQWRHEATLEELATYIRSDALPLKTDWFTGFVSTDFGMMLSLAELGEEIAATRADNEDFENSGSDFDEYAWSDYGWSEDDDEA